MGKPEFNKVQKGIEITNVEDSLLKILKINCKMSLIFKRNSQIISSIHILERLINKLEVQISVDGSNEVVSYSKLFEIVSDKIKLGVLSVFVEKSEYVAKESLFLMIENLNQKMINVCVFIDYDPKNKVYLLLNLDSKKGLSDKLYYYEENNSILGFSDNGPILIYGKTTSVEDIFCV